MAFIGSTVTGVAGARAPTKQICSSRASFAQFSGMRSVSGARMLQPVSGADANDAFFAAVSEAGAPAASSAPTMKLKVAISGFGRIGRNFLRAWAAKSDTDLEVVCINDTSGVKTACHLLKYDSILGTFAGTVEAGEDSITINGKKVRVVSNRDPLQLPWKELGIDIVIEATGVFVDKKGASKHIEAGAKKVLITAPGKGEGIQTYVVGVNDGDYNHATDDIVSNASCTTMCMAPFVKVLEDEFGIVKGTMTTTHSYTGDQRLLDAGHRDLRRARSAALNIVPTTTGAAQAVALVIPSMKGKLNGYALRVPTPNVSVCDVVVEVKRPTFKEEVNGAFLKAAQGPMKGILKYSDEPLVSSDFKGMVESTAVDVSMTTVVGDTMVKVLAWYDNEWSYSLRVLDLAEIMAAKWE